MQKDSLETLLLRHYGDTASTPAGLEQRLLASARQKAQALHQEQQAVAYVRQKQVSRRHAVRFVAIGTAGLGVLSAGLELLEAAVGGQDTSQTQTAFP